MADIIPTPNLPGEPAMPPHVPHAMADEIVRMMPAAPIRSDREQLAQALDQALKQALVPVVETLKGMSRIMAAASESLAGMVAAAEEANRHTILHNRTRR